MAWLESATGAAVTKAGAGFLGGFMGGILANLLSPPLKVKIINGHAILDDDGKTVMIYDKVLGARIVGGATIVGFASTFSYFGYTGQSWEWSQVAALASFVSAPLVFILIWLLNTLRSKQNTDLIDTAIDIRRALGPRMQGGNPMPRDTPPADEHFNGR